MIFLSLISSFFNALNALYAKKIVGEMRDNNSFIVTSFAFVGLFLGLTLPWLYLFKANAVSIPLLLLVVLLDMAGNLLFFKAMERIEVSVLSVYMALTPLFTFIPNSFLNGFHPFVLVSVLFIMVGVYFLNLKGRNPLTPFLELKKPGNLLGIAAAVVFGVSMVPSQQLLVHGWVNPVTLYFYRASGIAAITYLLYRPKLWFPGLNKHLSLRGMTVIIQWICLFTALKFADGTLVVSLAFTSPLFAVFLAWFYFKERITPAKLTACVITILGIIITVV
ncbi:DMT family transporter [Neobacillus novalis]|uniref:DMT family transporter n=1 Tax=Neobacillus novalis TaxID=220687 RepID=A0AA95MTU8_9BACI|nr:DMT family transporter [Neobacillus novalis]WHY88419.1 DMT family transporter [Neobacillus novalis]